MVVVSYSFLPHTGLVNNVFFSFLWWSARGMCRLQEVSYLVDTWWWQLFCFLFFCTTFFYYFTFLVMYCVDCSFVLPSLVVALLVLFCLFVIIGMGLCKNVVDLVVVVSSSFHQAATFAWQKRMGKGYGSWLWFSPSSLQKKRHSTNTLSHL